MGVTGLYYFLDSTYKCYHIAFVFLWLISLNVLFSRSNHFVTNSTVALFHSFLLLFFSHQVVSSSLWPHGLQHAKLPYPSLSSGVSSNSSPLSQWCHPTISPSVTPFSSHPQSFPASGSFPMRWLFASGGQSIGASASAWVLPMNIQGWIPLELTGLISLLSKGLSRAFYFLRLSNILSFLWIGRWTVFSILWLNNIPMELLVHMVVLFLIFWGTSILFFTVADPIYILSSSIQVFRFLHLLTNIYFVVFLMISHSDRYEMISQYFDLYFSNNQWCLEYFYLPINLLNFSLEKGLFPFSAHFLIRLLFDIEWYELFINVGY